MTAATPATSGTRRSAPFQWPPALLPGLFILAVTVFGAGIFDIGPIKLSRIALYTQLILLFLYFGKAVIRQHFGTAASFILLFLYIIWSHLRFAALSDTVANVNGLASFLPILSFIIFCETDASLKSMLRVLAGISLVYCAIYVLGHGWLLAANKASAGGVLVAASGRSERLYLLAVWAAYAVYYAWCNRDAHWLMRGALALFGLAAIWLSGSRMFQATFTIYAVLLMIGVTGFVVRWGTFAVFFLLSLVMLSGLIFQSFNPYSLMEWDTSAAYRMVEYARGAETIRSHFLLGIGLPLDMDSLIGFLRTPRYDLYFASDLGITSMLMMFGLPGLLLSVFFVYYCAAISGIHYQAREIKALQMTGLMACAIAWFSPMFFIESAVIFLGLLIALGVKSSRLKSGVE